MENEVIIGVAAIETEDTEFASRATTTGEEICAPIFTVDEAASRKKWWRSFIRAIGATVFAAVMVIMAFLPVTKVNLGDDLYENLTFSISAIDTVVFATDSFYSMSLEDLKDSELFERLEEAEEKFADSDNLSNGGYDELSPSGKHALDDMIRLLMRMQLRHESTATSATLVISAIIALAYIISAVALLIAALLHLAALFRLVRSRPDKVERFCRSLLLLTPLLAVSLFAANLLSFSRLVALGEIIDFSAHDGMMPTGGCIATLTLGGAAFILLLADSLLSGFRATRRDIVIRAISVSSSVVVMICLLCPVMVSHIYGTFSGRTTATTAKIEMSSSFFNNFCLTSQTWEEYAETERLSENEKKTLLKDGISELTEYSVREIRNGAADRENEVILMNYASIYGLYDWSAFFASTSALSLSGFVLAALTVWQSLGYFISSRDKRRTMLVLKISTGVCCIVSLAAVITFAFFVGYYSDHFNISNYYLSIGAAPIIATVMAILGIFISDNVANKLKFRIPTNARELYSLFDEPKYDVEK